MQLTAAPGTNPGTVTLTVDYQGTTYPAGTNLTIVRQDVLSGAESTMVSIIDPTVLAFDDLTPPLGRQLVYTATAGSDSATSSVISVSSPLPIISDQAGGSPVQATIYDWPELDYNSQTTVMRVPGRADPIVVLGVEEYPTSTITIVTLTTADLAAFRSLVASGQLLLVRAPCPSVETALFVITTRKEQRITKKGDDWRRLHVCDISHVASIGVFPSSTQFPATLLYPGQR